MAAAAAAIQRLYELAEQLPSLEAMVLERVEQSIEYDVAGGHCVGRKLDVCDGAALQKVIMTPGCQFLTHTHDAKEVMIVIEGEGYFIADGRRQNYSSGYVIELSPGSPHECYVQTTTVMYAVTMPPCEGYPGVK